MKHSCAIIIHWNKNLKKGVWHYMWLKYVWQFKNYFRSQKQWNKSEQTMYLIPGCYRLTKFYIMFPDWENNRISGRKNKIECKTVLISLKRSVTDFDYLKIIFNVSYIGRKAWEQYYLKRDEIWHTFAWTNFVGFKCPR